MVTGCFGGGREQKDRKDREQENRGQDQGGAMFSWIRNSSKKQNKTLQKISPVTISMEEKSIGAGVRCKQTDNCILMRPCLE